MSEAKVKLAGMAAENAVTVERVTVLAEPAMGEVEEQEAVMEERTMEELAEQGVILVGPAMEEAAEQEREEQEAAREAQAVPAGLDPERGQEREVLLKVGEQGEMVRVVVGQEQVVLVRVVIYLMIHNPICREH